MFYSVDGKLTRIYARDLFTRVQVHTTTEFWRCVETLSLCFLLFAIESCFCRKFFARDKVKVVNVNARKWYFHWSFKWYGRYILNDFKKRSFSVWPAYMCLAELRCGYHHSILRLRRRFWPCNWNLFILGFIFLWKVFISIIVDVRTNCVCWKWRCTLWQCLYLIIR